MLLTSCNDISRDDIFYDDISRDVIFCDVIPPSLYNYYNYTLPRLQLLGS